MCRIAGEHPGTSLEFIPTLEPFALRHCDLMARMSAAANRPLNWNALGVTAAGLPQAQEKLRASDYAAEHGGRVVALSIPMASQLHLSFLNGFMLDAFPGWSGPMALPPNERIRLLSDPEQRRRLDEGAQTSTSLGSFAEWAMYTISATRTRPRRLRTPGAW